MIRTRVGTERNETMKILRTKDRIKTDLTVPESEFLLKMKQSEINKKPEHTLTG